MKKKRDVDMKQRIMNASGLLQDRGIKSERLEERISGLQGQTLGVMEQIREHRRTNPLVEYVYPDIFQIDYKKWMK